MVTSKGYEDIMNENSSDARERLGHSKTEEERQLIIKKSLIWKD
jgi:hypothetical protein